MTDQKYKETVSRFIENYDGAINYIAENPSYAAFLDISLTDKRLQITKDSSAYLKESLNNGKLILKKSDHGSSFEGNTLSATAEMFDENKDTSINPFQITEVFRSLAPLIIVAQKQLSL